MPDLPSNQSSIITAGANMTITFTETEGGYWTINFASSGSGGGHTIQDDDVAMTARANLSFQDGFVLTDDAVGDQTEVDLSYATTAEVADVAETEGAGTSLTVARGDHVHSGNIYRQEAVDHTHQSAGAQAGTLDHGLALTGLTDDDHTQYMLESLANAKGDVFTATANDTPAVLTVGADDTILMARSSETTGLVWQAPAAVAQIADVADTEAAGTSDTWARGDHVHSGAAYRKESDVEGHIDFSISGTLSTGTGAHRWYNDTGRTITLASARGSVGTAPTGASILIDVNESGTSVWNTTQDNRITIAVSTNTDEGGAFDAASIEDGNYLTVDIDQVGSTVAGADLVVSIWYT